MRLSYRHLAVSSFERHYRHSLTHSLIKTFLCGQKKSHYNENRGNSAVIKSEVYLTTVSFLQILLKITSSRPHRIQVMRFLNSFQI